MSAATQRTVAVAYSAHDYHPDGRPVHVALLEDLGYRAFHVRDGDAAGLEADLLILYGNCRTFHRYGRLLRHSRNRPKVAIWQVDPLPPIEFDQRLEKVALRLSSVFSWSRLLRPTEMLIGLPLFIYIARRGLGPYSDRSKGNVVDYTMARTVVEAYGYLSRGARQRWIDQIFVSTTGKQKFLANRGFPSTFVPTGLYSRDLKQDAPRDIDVLFIGKLNKKRRRTKVEIVQRELARRGIGMVAVSRCYGAARTALLNRTKIVLNLNKYPWDTPWMRWSMATGCGCMMASETLYSPEPFEPGVHYVEAPFDELADTLQKLLADPQKVQCIARRCASFIEADMLTRGSMEKMVATSFPSEVAA